MKTVAAVMMGLSAVVALNAPAIAESFNDQSPNPVVSAPGATQVPRLAIIEESNRFNDRGVDYIVASMAGSPSALEPTMALDMHFNMK